MESWNDFCLAEAGASAALAGLIFVGVSINLERLLQFPAVLHRAAAALVLLMGVLVISSLVLIPGQSIRTVGWQALIVGILLWFATTALGIQSVQGVDAQYRLSSVAAVLLRQCATVPILVGGVLLITHDASGMRWIAAAFIFSFIVALTEGWLVLVEIAR